jgi:hypothetical protein
MSYGALSKLAQFGRGNDTMMAHVTPGEVMVPPELLMQDPRLRRALARAFISRGVDPREFMAGATRGTNPVTGLNEYGWFDKIIKKVTNSILPTVGSIVGGAAGQYLGVGAALGSGVGAGLGSLASGDDPIAAALTGVGSYAGAEFLGPELGLEGDFLGAAAGSQAGGALGAFGANVLSNLAFAPEKTDIGGLKVPQYNLPNTPLPGQINTQNPNGQQQSNNPAQPTGPGVNQLQPIKFLEQVKNRDTGEMEYTYVTPFGSSLVNEDAWNVYRI